MALKDEGRPDLEFRYGWIGPREAIGYLGIGSQSALYRLIYQWELPHGRMGQLYRFRRVDLDAWMTRSTTALATIKRVR